MTTRAERRHHVERLKKARRMYWRGYWNQEPLTPRQLGILSSTCKTVQCFCCAHLRKWHGAPMSDLRRIAAGDATEE